MARHGSTRILAAALLALTAILVGFAHKPISLEARGYGFEVAAYFLPDGTLPELCHFDDVGGHGPADHRPAAGAASCDACMLCGAPGLGAVAEIVLPTPVGGDEIRNVVADLVCRGSATFAPASRGPPVA